MKRRSKAFRPFKTSSKKTQLTEAVDDHEDIVDKKCNIENDEIFNKNDKSILLSSIFKKRRNRVVKPNVSKNRCDEDVLSLNSSVLDFESVNDTFQQEHDNDIQSLINRQYFEAEKFSEGLNQEFMVEECPSDLKQIETQNVSFNKSNKSLNDVGGVSLKHDLDKPKKDHFCHWEEVDKILHESLFSEENELETSITNNLKSLNESLGEATKMVTSWIQSELVGGNKSSTNELKEIGTGTELQYTTPKKSDRRQTTLLLPSHNQSYCEILTASPDIRSLKRGEMNDDDSTDEYVSSKFNDLISIELNTSNIMDSPVVQPKELYFNLPIAKPKGKSYVPSTSKDNHDSWFDIESESKNSNPFKRDDNKTKDIKRNDNFFNEILDIGEHQITEIESTNVIIEDDPDTWFQESLFSDDSSSEESVQVDSPSKHQAIRHQEQDLTPKSSKVQESLFSDDSSSEQSINVCSPSKHQAIRYQEQDLTPKSSNVKDTSLLSYASFSDILSYERTEAIQSLKSIASRSIPSYPEDEVETDKCNNDDSYLKNMLKSMVRDIVSGQSPKKFQKPNKQHEDPLNTTSPVDVTSFPSSKDVNMKNEKKGDVMKKAGFYENISTKNSKNDVGIKHASTGAPKISERIAALQKAIISKN